VPAEVENGVCEEFLYDIKGGLRPPPACGRRFAPSSAASAFELVRGGEVLPFAQPSPL